MGSFSDFQSKLLRYSMDNNSPLNATFELTSRCNLACKMCYVCAENDKKVIDSELSADQWVDLACQLRDMGLLYIMFSGGEVFVRKDFREIYERIYDLGMLLTINTNAMAITPEIIGWLKKRPPLRMAVSIYGASNEDYGRVSGNNKAFDYVDRGVRLLEESGISTRYRTIIIKETRESVFRVADYILSLGKQVGLVNYVSPSRDDTGLDPIGSRLPAVESVKLERAIYEHVLKRTNEIEAEKKRLGIEDEADKEDLSKIESVDDSLPEKIPQKPREGAFKCGASHCTLWITWDGQLTPCALMSRPTSFPLEGGIAKAWEDLKALCAEVHMPKECDECPDAKYCLKCPARILTETGGFSEKAPYLCERAAYMRSQKEDN